MEIKIQYYIDSLFQMLNVEKTGQITLQQYTTQLQKYPNLLNVFDFLNQGMTEIIESTQLVKREIKIANDIKKIEDNIQQVLFNITENEPGEFDKLEQHMASDKDITQMAQIMDLRTLPIVKVLTQSQITSEANQ